MFGRILQSDHFFLGEFKNDSFRVIFLIPQVIGLFKLLFSYQMSCGSFWVLRNWFTSELPELCVCSLFMIFLTFCFCRICCDAPVSFTILVTYAISPLFFLCQFNQHFASFIDVSIEYISLCHFSLFGLIDLCSCLYFLPSVCSDGVRVLLFFFLVLKVRVQIIFVYCQILDDWFDFPFLVYVFSAISFLLHSPQLCTSGLLFFIFIQSYVFMISFKIPFGPMYQLGVCLIFRCLEMFLFSVSGLSPLWSENTLGVISVF